MLRWCAFAFSIVCLGQATERDSSDFDKSLVDPNPIDVKEFEARVARNPEDLSARLTLAEYLKSRGPRVELLDHVLYMVEHHPESALAVVISRKAQPGGHSVATPKDYERVVEAWKKAASKHPQNARVRSNAAEFQ